jgi:hypothetical protein
LRGGQLRDLRLEPLLHLVQLPLAFHQPGDVVRHAHDAGHAVQVDDDRGGEERDPRALETKVDLELAHVSVSLQSPHEPLALLRPYSLTNLERRSGQRLLAAKPGAPEKLRIDIFRQRAG